MNDLGHISTQLWELFRCGTVPDELIAGGTLRCALDDRRCIQLRFQSRQQRWLLGVDQMIDTLGEDSQARCQEALLRVAHASRWTAQQVGALDAEGGISLVDCDFPGTPQQAAALADATLIEGRLAALLHRLETLTARETPASSAAPASSAIDDNSWRKA
ncbi:hypothetical protein [Pantoea sp. 18069]|uniref:hypothetical protein n=1 Tax=Pantoea sp. 18069 TaxID=2681415 RepID=UPI001359E7F8|nr:hypothetical protein [Pantoea sp. 18069]